MTERALSFNEIGKLHGASKQCDFRIKMDFSKGVHFVMPDGWKVEATHLLDRSEKAITSWLTVLWTIRTLTRR